MNQTTRTLLFAGAAVTSLGIAAFTHSSYQPEDPLKNIPVGQAFFADFKNPEEATSLQVATYDEGNAKTNVFKVENKGGLWRIPSHHDYPADGESRLAKTATSIIGVTRKAFVEASEAAHKRYKLLDPLDDSVSGTEGRGDRITLTKGDEVLADFIVGNSLEGEQGTYYVRRADEKAVYTADLGNLELSTKFADWIQQDLLDISRNDIRELIIDNYHIDESQGVVVQEDRNLLSRKSNAEDWSLEGLNPEAEKIKTSEVNNMLAALDDLQIVGVRKKPEGLSSELKTSEGMALTLADRLDLQDKGYFVDPRQGRLLSNEGEVIVGSENGALYVLRFGEEFSGSDVDIEVGKAKSADSEKAAEDQPIDAAEEASKDPEKPTDEEPKDALQKSRYAFITVQFDQDLIGEKPAPPVKPEPPAETPAAETTDEAAADAEATPPAAGEEQKPAEAKPDPKAEYEKALKDYEVQQEVYEIKLKDYEKKLADGQKKVDDLNARFADWYYVISADVFDRLKLKREALVEAVEKKEEAPAEPVAPASTPPAEGTAEEMKKEMPADGTPPAVPPTSEAPKEGDAPAAEKLPEVKPGESLPDKPDAPPAPEKPTEATPSSGGEKPAVPEAQTPAPPATETPPPEAPATTPPPTESGAEK